MSLIKRIQTFITTKPPKFLFEIKEGSHSRFITFDEWYRERKENAFIEYKIGRIGNSNQLIGVRQVKNERIDNERQ